MNWNGVFVFAMLAAGFGVLLGYLMNSIEGLKKNVHLAKCRIDNLYELCELLEARIRSLKAQNDAEKEVKNGDQK